MRRGRKRSQVGERSQEDKTEIRMGSAVSPWSLLRNGCQKLGLFFRKLSTFSLVKKPRDKCPINLSKDCFDFIQSQAHTFVFLPKGSGIWQSDPITH